MFWYGKAVFLYQVSFGSLVIIIEFISACNKVNSELLLIFLLQFVDFFSPTNHLPEKTGSITTSHGNTSGIVQVLCVLPPYIGSIPIVLSRTSLARCLQNSKFVPTIPTFCKFLHVRFVFTSYTERYQSKSLYIQNLVAQFLSIEIWVCIWLLW